MNKFTLQQLLIDAMTYGPALNYQFQSVKSYQDARLDMIHFLVENLIGYDPYILLYTNPNRAQICFRPDGKTHISMYHMFT